VESSLSSGTCPKCSQQEVSYTEEEINKIVPHSFADYKFQIVRSRPSPVVINFVCGNCGYAEFHVPPASMEAVKKYWDRL
jgi:predicted nucleic-acid-binding Zn-ribbon protein